MRRLVLAAAIDGDNALERERILPRRLPPVVETSCQPLLRSAFACWLWRRLAGYGASILLKGKSIKEIARDLKMSRNTVRKVLRSEETSFSYEREVQPRPEARALEGRDRSDADANAGASARERLTLIRIFEELRALGYEGGYDAVRRYARAWAPGARERRRRTPLCR